MKKSGSIKHDYKLEKVNQTICPAKINANPNRDILRLK